MSNHPVLMIQNRHYILQVGYTPEKYEYHDYKILMHCSRLSLILPFPKAGHISLHNKKVGGCSAEGHVSHVLSDRLSSRPMGWSQTGADRMSKLRCYERNYGREKIIDLVRYSRERRKDQRTGTDDIPTKHLELRSIIAEHYNQYRSYVDRFQATIPGLTVRKIASIREQIRLL